MTPPSFSGEGYLHPATGTMAGRIQLRRTKGWRKPPGTVIVARPSMWGNPWSLDAVLFGAEGGWPLLAVTPDLAVALYRAALIQGALDYDLAHVHAELAGKDLACWCPPSQPCHADVLLELANPVFPGLPKGCRCCQREQTTWTCRACLEAGCEVGWPCRRPKREGAQKTVTAADRIV